MTELVDTVRIGCPSFIRAVNLLGSVVDDGFGGSQRRRPHGVLRNRFVGPGSASLL